MDPSAVLLLEVNQLATGKRMAFCLLSGEFVLVSADAAPQLGAKTAFDLIGQNILPLLVPCDAEKLQDLVRQADAGLVGFDGSTQSELATMARVARTGSMLWLRVLRVPVSLRLLRCMDSLATLRFADAASFVLSDDELVSTGSASDAFSFPRAKMQDVGFEEGKASYSYSYGYSYSECRDDDGLVDYRDVSVHGPLELMSCKADALSVASPTNTNATMTTMEDEERLSSVSLSSLAFEADWGEDDNEYIAEKTTSFLT